MDILSNKMSAGGIKFISDESRIISAEINSRVLKICKENCRMYLSWPEDKISTTELSGTHKGWIPSLNRM